MPEPCVILWFRQDLRLADNPALCAAAQTGLPVLPVYIFDENEAGPWAMGAASRVWLHHSLEALDRSLKKNMTFFAGSSQQLLQQLIRDTGAKAVYWNRCYEPWRIARDKEIKKTLEESGIEVKSFNGALLNEPWEVLKDDGTAYKVFTPYFRRGVLGRGEPRSPLPVPVNINWHKPEKTGSIEKLTLLPRTPRWDKPMVEHWEIGERGAIKRFDYFLEHGLKNYKEGRNNPNLPHVSRLSPSLHFGEISPHTLWHEVRRRMVAERLETDGDHFLSELGWREFSYSLLYYNPDLPEKPLQKKFSGFPWIENNEALERWQKGLTGYPIVDAGMRELWHTGWMHNRVRMIVASFLIKDLFIHWRAGEAWFWDTLFDADLANNAASWQWVAGCGADAAPYFRIFNPVGQGEKFDPDGDYVRKWIPELRDIPGKTVHWPWEQGVKVKNTYPPPMIDHKMARERALQAFADLKEVAVS